MSSTMDYKKKLMAYRKSIRSNPVKTVAFKETNSHDMDIHFSSPEPLLQTFSYPHRQRQSPMLETDLNLANISSVLRDLSFSRTPSPQPQPKGLPTRGSGRETFMSEPIGRYTNWNSQHNLLASHPWCSIGDLMGFCDKYEFKAIGVSDVQTHANIVSEVKALLSGKAPFDARRRFPGNFKNEGSLLVCIGRCPSIEYHLQRILSIFRRPLNKLSTEKQNIAKQNFHIAIRELHLDVSARITEVRLYDRALFEKEFHLKWQDPLETSALY